MSYLQVNGRDCNPVVSLLLFVTRLPYLLPFMGWVWFGIVSFNAGKLPWFVLIPVLVWSLICSKAVRESGEVIKQQIRENDGIVTTQHEVSMVLLNITQYPTFLAAMYVLFSGSPN